MTGHLHVKWVDAGREPRCKPDPRFPHGMDIDVSEGRLQACETALPYPAERCGSFIVECGLCGLKVALSTAGRPDDPRSIKIACKPMGAA